MPIPPQFLKHTKGKKPDNAKEDAKDGGADDSQESGGGNPFAKSNPFAKGGAAPKRDSKDPKGAKGDLIPSGPMKGKNPNQFHKGGKGAGKAAFLKDKLKKGGF